MPRRGTQPALPGDADDELDAARGVTVWHWVSLGLNAARRRKLLVAFVFLVGVAASAAYYLTRTPVYRVHATVLAQRPQALPSVVRPLFEDAPARSAWDMIHRRDNLIALIRQANLLAEDGAAPAREPGLAERLAALVGRGGTRLAALVGRDGTEDPLDLMVAILDKHLLVSADEATITIQLDWPDPQQAHAVVQAALQNFLEARHVQEVTAIDEVIAVLQGHAAGLRKDLDAATAEAPKRPAPTRSRAPQRATQQSDELVTLQSKLEAKRRAVQDVEEFRRRRLADLDAQLAQARNSLSEAHPTVIALRKDLDALAGESPQLEALRADERGLRRELADRLAREGVAAPATTTPPALEAAERGSEEDPRVRDARQQYEQMNARVSAAQVELDAARTAFKYRYKVIWPPQVPKEPVGASALKILGAGAIASLLLAIVAAAAPDVLRGRVVERWQVERILDVPVLGELKRK
jgi:uncharacterized protein involved in exopolysaccharide biosynthesis